MTTAQRSHPCSVAPSIEGPVGISSPAPSYT